MTTPFLTGDNALVRRSRLGDSHAARRLASRYLDRITLLASVVASAPEEATPLTRRAFRRALRGPRPFDDALVRAFGTLAAERHDAEQAQGRLLVLLVEVEGRPTAEVAGLIGIPAAAARTLLPAARAAAGPAHPARPCRGWGLLASPAALTTPERRAGAAHLLLCRRCRDRRAALERTRAQLLGGSAGVVGALAATQVVPLSGSAGLTLAFGGKAGMAIVGSAASAVLATAGTVAVVEPAAFQPAPRPVVTAPAAIPSTSASAPAAAAHPSASPSGGTVRPTLTVPLPTAVPRANQPPPTELPLPLPTLPLPTALPLPLPTPLTTLLPVPLPTEIELPALP